jgi:Uma2 family endonuclease
MGIARTWCEARSCVSRSRRTATGVCRRACSIASKRSSKKPAFHWFCVGPIGSILARNPDTVRGPDVAVIRGDRLPPRNAVGFLEGAPDLVIEIVSPSNNARQIREKVTDYLAAGATCVWVIEPRRRTASRHSPDGAILQLHAPAELGCDDVLPGFRVDLTDLFGRPD